MKVLETELSFPWKSSKHSQPLNCCFSTTPVFYLITHHPPLFSMSCCGPHCCKVGLFTTSVCQLGRCHSVPFRDIVLVVFCFCFSPGFVWYSRVYSQIMSVFSAMSLRFVNVDWGSSVELKAAGFPLLEPVHLSLSFLHVVPRTAQVLPQKHAFFKSDGVESFNFKSAFGLAKEKKSYGSVVF